MSIEDQGGTAHPIEGVWEPIKGELNGELVPDMVLNHLTFTLSKGRYEMHYGGQPGDTGTYVLAHVPGKHPTITLFRDELPKEADPLMPAHFPSIYQLRGDRLRICHSLDGSPPANFSSSQESNCYLITYRRKLG